MKEGKIRKKFAYKEQIDMEFKHWDHFILCGYSRELANNCTVLHSSVLYCIKREGWKREKWENLLTSRHRTDRRFKDWHHSILCGYSRELANNDNIFSYFQVLLIINELLIIRYEDKTTEILLITLDYSGLLCILEIFSVAPSSVIFYIFSRRYFKMFSVAGK